MNQLRQLFEEAADVPAPPSRLSADSVYANSRRRTRLRIAAAGTGSVVAVAVAGSFAGLWLAGQAGPGPVPSPGTQDYIHDGAVLSVTAADRNHLYAVVAACRTDDPHYSVIDDCTDRLFGSEDSGHSWTLRNADIDRTSVGVLAPGVLAADVDAVEHDGFPDASRLVPQQTKSTSPRSRNGDDTALISRDGGRTWTRWTPKQDAIPVAAVPAGNWLACHWDQPLTGCTLTANDPATGRSSPLAHQPPLNVEQVDDLAGAGLWVSGQDPDSDYPAVGVSTDRGRTWTVHVFGPGEPDHPGDLLHIQGAVPATIDGRTVYVVVPEDGPRGEARRVFVYRSVDGGATWQRADPDHTLPYAEEMQGTSYVAADGTHVVYNLGTPPASWSVSGDAGTTYQPARLTGLGALRDPRGVAVAPGAYLVWDNDSMYRSSDGIHWTRLPTPGR